ncbi:MAG: T9SS type A sorting domain-containing protein [candidate division KSB1 bacterium]|nr:T9SS type A sorting domain-containing protein [candidate division KSB1 bacterium]
MKKKSIFILILLGLTQLCFANPDAPKFAIIRLDYLSFSIKHIYYFQQPYQQDQPKEHERVYHELFVHITPASDFGGTTIRSAKTGKVVYEATTVWAGTGKHLFPSTEFEIGKPDTIIKPNPEFIDIENCFFTKGDSTRADTAYQTASNYAPFKFFEADRYGAFIYLHYFSVGTSDPYTAEWVIIFYSLAESSSGRWVDISGDLPNLHINSIAPHPFYTDSLYVGTDAGAFQTNDGGKHWRLIKFDDNPAVKITQIKAESHPILDWTVPVLWLGTEEYTMIPEDRLGRIFFSVNGGMEWKNTYFPKIAVTAIEVPYDSSLVAFAGAYNPFYNQDGFYASDDTGWVKFDLTPGDTTAIRINDIDVDGLNPKRIFLATSNGLFATTDGGKSWNQIDPHHPSTAVVISPFNPKEIYAILLCGTRSEGIYRSNDDGQNWDRRCWTVNASNLIADHRTPGVWYWSVKNVGVFKSSDDCSTHIEINEGLKEKDILCLVQDRRNLKILYAGTTHGIFRYEEVPTSIEKKDSAPAKHPPSDFGLFSCYPNPFNAATVIQYYLPQACHIKLELFDTLGRRVALLINEPQSAGPHAAIWTGKDQHGTALSAGIYFVRVTAEKTTSKMKILLLK